MGRKKNIEHGATLRFYFLTFIITLFIITILFLGRYGVISDIYTNIFPVEYYSKAIVDITAEGQRYQLKAVGKCTRKGGKSFLLGSRLGIKTSNKKEGGIAVKKLPSGAALIIKTPILCALKPMRKLNIANYGNSGPSFTANTLRISLNSSKFFWLDNAKYPKRIEVYSSKSFASPYTKIKLHGIVVEPIQREKIQSPTQEVPWLKEFYPCKKNKKNNYSWVAFYTALMGKEDFNYPNFQNIIKHFESTRKIAFASNLMSRVYLSPILYKNHTNSFCILCEKTGNNYLILSKLKTTDIERILMEASLSTPFERSRKKPYIVLNKEDEKIGLINYETMSSDMFCLSR